jgi:uroporphyrin-III C-methyltransferase / precorrin-2 dehydrogenase / sirohydrochlorin ferrochelatase
MTRAPLETRPGRMEPLARLPVFLALAGKRAVLAGGSQAAAWKAELLAAAGAHVEVFCAEPEPEMLSVAAEPPAGSIVIHHRAWTPADLPRAAIAIGAIEEEHEGRAFFEAAHAAGVPVNVVDRPELCDFAFGSIVNRSPLIIGISTDGAAPVFGQAIRAKIEIMLPPGLKRWAKAAKDWRGAVQALGLSFQGRRRFWERFTERALARPQDWPTFNERDALVAKSAAEAARPETGRVLLVGAGPGDPGLVTLAAVRALQSADVILYDDLVAPEVLELARREARTMLVGKTGHRPSCKQEDINALMVSLAAEGRVVVRLKTGDPLIFGRATEEMAACRAAGVPVEVIPGISAAQGAAARLGLSLTQRKVARRVQFVTGHDHHGDLPPDFAWDAIADPAAATAIYMPRSTLAAFSIQAIAAGLPAETPAVAVIEATRSTQSVVRGTLATLPGLLADTSAEGPAVVLLGAAFAELEDVVVGDVAVGDTVPSQETALRA